MDVGKGLTEKGARTGLYALLLRNGRQQDRTKPHGKGEMAQSQLQRTELGQTKGAGKYLTRSFLGGEGADLGQHGLQGGV